MGRGKRNRRWKAWDDRSESGTSILDERKVNTGLTAFKFLQDLYIRAQDIGAVENIREHVPTLVSPFDREVEAILSVAGSRVGNSDSLANVIATVAPLEMRTLISAGVEAAEPASALWGFGTAWRRATRAERDARAEADESDEFDVALSRAIASNDVAETGRLLVSKDVNETRIKARSLPARLLRQPAFGCPALDVAMGSGAVDVAKVLLEFLRARPARETLRRALSSGNFELVRICWERLPDEREKGRLDLLEVASDFHQLEVLAWLFRDAGKFEREVLVDFAIK
jgi:hypothetical protein